MHQVNTTYWRQDPLNCSENCYPLPNYPQDLRDSQPFVERLLRAYIQNESGKNPVRAKTYNVLSDGNYSNTMWQQTVVFAGQLLRFYVNTLGNQVDRNTLAQRAAKDASDFMTLKVFEGSPEYCNPNCPPAIAQGFAAFKNYIGQILNQMQQSQWGGGQQSSWGQQQSNAWGSQQPKQDSVLSMFQGTGATASEALFRRQDESGVASSGNAMMDAIAERDRLLDEAEARRKEAEAKKSREIFGSGLDYDQFSGGPDGYNTGTANTGHGFSDHFQPSQSSTHPGAPDLDWLSGGSGTTTTSEQFPDTTYVHDPEPVEIEDAVLVEEWVQTPVGDDVTRAIHPAWDLSMGKPPYLPYVHADTPVPNPKLPVPLAPAFCMGIRVAHNIYTQVVLDGWIYSAKELHEMDETKHQLRYDLRPRQEPVGRVVPIYELQQDDTVVDQDFVTEAPVKLEQIVVGLEIDSAANSVMNTYNVVGSNRPAHFTYMNSRAVQVDQRYNIEDLLGNFVWTGKHANADLSVLAHGLKGLQVTSEYLYGLLNTFATQAINRVLRYELNTIARVESFADDYSELLDVLRKKYGDSILPALARCAPLVARSVACVCPPQYEDRLFLTTVTPFTAMASGFVSTPKGVDYCGEEEFTRLQTEIGDPDTPIGNACSYFVGMVRLNYMACVPWTVAEMGLGSLKAGERLLFASTNEYHAYFESVLQEAESGAPVSRVTIVTPQFEAIDLHRSEVGTQGAIVVERRSIFG